MAAPRKAPGGLEHVLYVRVGSSLKRQLTAFRKRETKRLGVTVGQAEAVRLILGRYLEGNS